MMFRNFSKISFNFQPNVIIKNLTRFNELNKYKQTINKIKSIKRTIKNYDNSELKAITYGLRYVLDQEKKREDILLKNSDLLRGINPLELSFALVREVSSRLSGLEHYDVQLLGGLVLNDGKIAEMKTGEGKTIVANLPAYYNSLSTKGVHIVTVNEYLAARDQKNIGKVFQFLGLDTGLIKGEMGALERKANYKADITYVTNNELGFDYLRDNTTIHKDQVVLRPFNYAIIDEIDSILIDEAQTPLIISEPESTPFRKYLISGELIKYLEINKHFTIDEKNKNIVLTEQGIKCTEEILEIDSLYNLNDPWMLYIINALKAKTFFFENIHYLIRNNQVTIIDQFTGRVLKNSRWDNGLHQAVEVKENVPINKNSTTIASITYQNFFSLYPKLSGMTGTAQTAELEFRTIYELPIIEVPTYKPNQRTDLPDLVYKDQFAKWNAIALKCQSINTIGQPILIGTTTVEKSELLAELLKEYQLTYQLLNAKPENSKRESEIIAKAGRVKNITIATNMAGRGTDIILGGNIQFISRKDVFNSLIRQKSRKSMFPLIDKNLLKYKSHQFLSVLSSLVDGYNYFLDFSNILILEILINNEQIKKYKTVYNIVLKFLRANYTDCQNKHIEHEKLITETIGGLYVIGSERNDSTRIDNQLRGRCGRQGQPGTSQFFLSLEDTIIRLFSRSNIKRLIKNQIDSKLPIESKAFLKSMDLAQQTIEDRAYQQRKFLVNYDKVVDNNRRCVYYERKLYLKNSVSVAKLLTYNEQTIISVLEKNKKFVSIKQILKMCQYIKNLYGRDIPSTTGTIMSFRFLQLRNSWIGLRLLLDRKKKVIKEFLFKEAWVSLKFKYFDFESKIDGTFLYYNRIILLTYLDDLWEQTLEQNQLVLDTISWRRYGQRNPLYDYQKGVLDIFRKQIITMRQTILYEIFHAVIR